MTDAQIASAVALYQAVVDTYKSQNRGTSMHVSLELWYECKQAVLRAKLEVPTA